MLAAVVLLPPAWLAARLAMRPEAIRAMCLEATHYPPSRCEPEAILLRGLAVLVIPGLALVGALWWVLLAQSERASRTRKAVARSEWELAHDLRQALVTTPRSHAVALLLLIVLATSLRALLINQPMRSDENQTFLLYSGRSLDDAVWRFDTTNNHILFSVLARVTIVLFGHSPWSARLPETVCGILLVPATALALRRAYGMAPSLLAAGFVAALPYLVSFSTNARGYSVVAFCFVLAIPVAARVLERGDVAAWSALVFLAALGMLANLTGVYPFGALFAWIAWRRLRASSYHVSSIADVALAGVALSFACWLLYGPALTAMGVQALVANPWMKPPAWSEFTASLLVTVDGLFRDTWSNWGWGIWAPLWIVLSALMVLALVRDWRAEYEARGLLAALLLWSALVAIGSHRVPYVRVFLPTLPLFLAAMMALAIEPLRRRAVDERSPLWAGLALGIAGALALTRESARTLFYT